MNKKILICTGGTGGHVIPAINFGNFLIDNGYICSVILDKRGVKYSKDFKGDIHIINAGHLSGNILFKIKSSFLLLNGFFQSLFIIIKSRPNIALSFGGHATFMPQIVILCLKFFFKIDMYIHEQNTILGKVHLFFLPYVRDVFTNFKDIKNIDLKYLYKKQQVGLPSKEIKKNYQFLNIKEKKIIFIYGGSQGSEPLIKSILLLLEKADNVYLKNTKIIIQCPNQLTSYLKKFLKKLNLEFQISDFYTDIDTILSNTTIAITRAGAGTINDLIRYKIPSIIIPLPHSIYNHQYYNAKYLTDINAAILMDEKNFNIDINTNILIKLLNSSNQQQEMKNILKKIIIPEANIKMLERILK